MRRAQQNSLLSRHHPNIDNHNNGCLPSLPHIPSGPGDVWGAVKEKDAGRVRQLMESDFAPDEYDLSHGGTPLHQAVWDGETVRWSVCCCVRACVRESSDVCVCVRAVVDGRVMCGWRACAS